MRARDGMLISCTIDGTHISRAMIIQRGERWFIAQNEKSGDQPVEGPPQGYRFTWVVGRVGIEDDTNSWPVQDILLLNESMRPAPIVLPPQYIHIVQYVPSEDEPMRPRLFATKRAADEYFILCINEMIEQRNDGEENEDDRYELCDTIEEARDWQSDHADGAWYYRWIVLSPVSTGVTDGSFAGRLLNKFPKKNADILKGGWAV